jgi:uncharacterized membrane protein
MAENIFKQSENGFFKLPILAAFIALLGLADAVYLTIHHFTGEAVPCNLVTGCETVLSSQYAEMFGIPTAAFGAAAYFLAFSLAILAAYGNRAMWSLFGALVVVMAIFTAYLIYLQGFVIEAFCQFCLISAATTLTLFIIFIFSKIYNSR